MHLPEAADYGRRNDRLVTSGSREKSLFSIFENINPGKDNSDEADTEKNTQWQDRIGMRRNDSKERRSSMEDSQTLRAWRKRPEESEPTNEFAILRA